MKLSQDKKCSQVSGRVVNLNQTDISKFEFRFVVDENLFLLQMIFPDIAGQQTDTFVLFHEYDFFSLSPSLSTIALRIFLRSVQRFKIASVEFHEIS